MQRPLGSAEAIVPAGCEALKHWWLYNTDVKLILRYTINKQYYYSLI